MDKEYLKQKAKELIQLTKTHFTNEQGILIKGRNDSTGKVYKEIIIDDLGDYLPFFAYFGEEEFCRKQLDYVEHNIDNLNFNRVFSYTDLLFGLTWYCQLGRGEERAKVLAKKIYNLIIKIFLEKSKPGSYLRYGKLVPVFNTIDSTLVENFIEYYRISNDSSSLDKAIKLCKLLSENAFFNQHGLLPEIINYSFWLNPIKLIYPEKFNRPKIMKNNTSFGFSLLDLWRLTKEDKYEIIFSSLYKGLKDNAVFKGGICNYPFSNKKIPDLVSSFAVIDLMADAYFIFKEDKYLRFAENLAGFWMGLQSKTTGLFPENQESRFSYLDSETDMSVALFKLAELTDKEEYYASATSALKGIFKFHKKEKGYILQVDISDGQEKEEIYRTKFNTLLLKPIIYLISEKKIYQDDLIFTLMKDR